MRSMRYSAVVLMGFVAGLAITPASGQQVDIKPAAKVKRDKYVITAAEIAERPDLTNAYDAVKMLRPEFLKTSRSRGSILGSSATGGYRPEVLGRPPGEGSATPTTTSSGEPVAGGRTPSTDDRGEGGPYASSSGIASSTTAVLYVDDVKQPGLDELKNIRPGEVLEIRYVTGNQAVGRYGAGHEGGAILLKTNRMGRP